MATEKSVAAAKPRSPRSEAPRSEHRFVKYLKEVMTELRKTTWPTKPELIAQTQIVLAVVIFIGVFVAGWDWVLSRIFEVIMRLIGVEPPTGA